MKRFCSLLLFLAMASSSSAQAQWSEYPAGDLDSRLERTQEKVETLYLRGDYKRAHFIYSNELSRQGDKYAQYMTGYMYLMGQGVAEDPVRASAWYRLASERRVPEFLSVRDQLLRTLSDEQRARSDAIYVELRKEYSDLVVAMRNLQNNLENLQKPVTGSRLTRGSNMVTVIDPRTGLHVPPDRIRNREQRAAQARLDFITTRLDIDSIRVNQAEQHVAGLWERINEFVSVVDDDTDGLYAAP